MDLGEQGVSLTSWRTCIDNLNLLTLCVHPSLAIPVGICGRTGQSNGTK